MAWEVVFDETAQTIVTTFTGVSKREDLMKAYQKRKQISQETGSTRLLIDTTECITDIFITVDMYTLVEKMYSEDSKQRAWRIAVLQSNYSSTEKVVDFYKNVTKNRGWNVKEFVEWDEAIDWLASTD